MPTAWVENVGSSRVEGLGVVEALDLLRSHLKPAGLDEIFEADRDGRESVYHSMLDARVNVKGPTYFVALRYYKWVTDRASGDDHLAPTWPRFGFGLHHDTAALVLNDVRHMVIEFVAAYQRVNGAACCCGCM